MSCFAWSEADNEIETFEESHQMSLYPSNKSSRIILNEFGTVFRFNLDVLHLKNGGYLNLPSVELNDIMWTVRFSQLNNYINVSLAPVFSGNADDLIEVQAAFKLLQKQNKRDKSFVRLLSKQVIKRTVPVGDSLTVLNFVNVNDFMENFVYDNKATFEFEIITNPLNRKDLTPKLGLDVMSKKIFVELENVSNLNRNDSLAGQKVSAETEVRGVIWKILTEKKNGYFGVYLQADENNLGKWSYEVDATFKLLSFNSSVKPIQNSFTHKFNLGSTTRGFERFLGWFDLVSDLNQFVVNNTANIFVDVKVEDPEPLWSF